MKKKTKSLIKNILLSTYYGLIAIQAFLMSLVMIFVGFEVLGWMDIPEWFVSLSNTILWICLPVAMLLWIVAICRGIYFLGNAVVKTICKIKLGNKDCEDEGRVD